FSQVLTVDIPEHRFRIDPYDKIIVVQQQNLDDYSNLADYEEIDLVLTNFNFQFNAVPASFEFTGSYMVNNGSDDYSLFFTQLPLLKIQTGASIPGTGSMNAQFLYADFQQVLIGDIKLSNQNTYLSANPKKSYSMEFWTESGSQIPLSVEFEDMQSSSNWVLNSMCNDPLRIRTFNTHKLWLDIYQPSYLQQEPEALAGTEGKYVEAFVNGHYMGIYMLSQELMPELLQLRRSCKSSGIN